MRIFASPRCLCFLCLMSVIKKDVIIKLCVCVSKSWQPVDVWPRNSLSSARTLNCFNPNLPQAFLPKLKGTTFFFYTQLAATAASGAAASIFLAGTPRASCTVTIYFRLLVKYLCFQAIAGGDEKSMHDENYID